MSNVQLSIPIPPDPDLKTGSRFRTISGNCTVTRIQQTGNDRLIWGEYGNGIPQPHQPEAIRANSDQSVDHFHPEDRVKVKVPLPGEPELKGRSGTVLGCVQVDDQLQVKVRLDGDPLSRRFPLESLQLIEQKSRKPLPVSVDYLAVLALRLNEGDRRQLLNVLQRSLPEEGASATSPLKPQSPGYQASGWVEVPPIGGKGDYRFRWRSDGQRKSRKLKTPLEIKLFQWLTEVERDRTIQFNLRVLENLRHNVEETLDTLVAAGVISDQERSALLQLHQQEEVVQQTKADLGLSKGR